MYIGNIILSFVSIMDTNKMDKNHIQDLINTTFIQVQKCMKLHNDKFPLTKGRWDIDITNKTITFQNQGKKAIAQIQIIGTRNPIDNTWLWSWANSSLSENICVHARILQKYGHKYKSHTLTNEKMKCTVDFCWEMLTLAFALTNADGIYRATREKSDPEVWLTYTNLEYI